MHRRRALKTLALGLPMSAAANPPAGTFGSASAATVATVATVASAAPALPAGAPAGTLVIQGGAVKDGNDALWQAVVQGAGGPGARVLVLPTASADPQRSGELAAAQLRLRGAVTEVLPIAPTLPGGSLAQARAQAMDAAMAARVQAAGGVFMTGGEQERLMDVLRPAGEPTPLLRALQALHARGGVVAGTSAGAAVMSTTAIRGLDEPFDALRRPLRDDELGSGFSLLPAHVVGDQHFLRRGRLPRLVRVLLQAGRSLGLGVEEDSAAIVRGGIAEAAGARGLLLVDAADAIVDAVQPLHVRGLRLAYVDRGDRYDLTARRVLPPATRQPLRPGAEAGSPGFFGDILADNVIVGAMARAAEGPGRAATGLAWRRDDALAFEFLLRADDRTRAWGGPTRDDHTIDALRLDIRPVRLAQPVYEPLPG